MSKKRKGRKKGMYETKTEIVTKANSATNFKLVIPDDVYQKIAYWLRKTTNEVSGFGSLAWEEKTSVFTVKDVILLKQEVGRASTEIDPVSLGKAMFEMKDEPLGLKWHWHTHPNMGVFWSADDMEIIRSLGQQGWIIASVFNEKGEVKSAFYTKTQVLGRDHDVFRDDLPTEITRFLPSTFFRALDKEYDEHVTQRVTWVGPGTHTKTGKHYGTTPGGHDWEGWDGEDWRPHALNPARWEKKLEYSDYGYADIGGDWIYNPLFDKALKDETEQLDMIAEMDTSEVELLKTCDTKFSALYNKYVLREANAGNTNATQEGMPGEPIVEPVDVPIDMRAGMPTGGLLWNPS